MMSRYHDCEVDLKFCEVLDHCSVVGFGRLCQHNFKHNLVNEHYFKLLFQLSAASIIRAFMR